MSSICFDDVFSGRPVDPVPSAGAPGARLSIGLPAFTALHTIAGMLEESASSEAAVRLAAMALRRALADVTILPAGPQA